MGPSAITDGPICISLSDVGYVAQTLSPNPINLDDQPCFLSKNCSSSVDPFSAAVEALASMVVVTASK